MKRGCDLLIFKSQSQKVAAFGSSYRVVSGLFGYSLDAALALGLKQAHAGRHGNVEAADATRHRQVHQVVTKIAGQATHAAAFSTHDQDGRAGHVLSLIHI